MARVPTAPVSDQKSIAVFSNGAAQRRRRGQPAAGDLRQQRQADGRARTWPVSNPPANTPVCLRHRAAHASPPARRIPAQAKKRLMSRDATRGLTVAVMIFVDDAGGVLQGRVNHSPWCAAGALALLYG